MLLPRILSLSVWALALSVIRLNAKDLRFSSVQGLARRLPTSGMGILFPQLSLAGFPLLAGFPILISLWYQFSRVDPTAVIWAFIGSVGLIVGGLRSLAVLVMGPEEQDGKIKAPLFSTILLWIGMLGLFAIGLFPNWFSQVFLDLIGQPTFSIP